MNFIKEKKTETSNEYQEVINSFGNKCQVDFDHYYAHSFEHEKDENTSKLLSDTSFVFVRNFIRHHTQYYSFKIFKWNSSIEITISAKLRLEDVLRTSLKEVLWTPPYGLLWKAKGRPLPTSWGRPLLTSLGRWNMTSWGRLDVTSWGWPRIVLYVCHGTSPTDVLRTSPADVMRTFLYGLIFTSKGRVLQTSWGRPSEASLHGSISKDKKHKRDKDFCLCS